MKKQNYYERVIKRKKELKRQPFLRSWAKKEKLTDEQLDRAINSLIHGRGSFEK